MRSHQTYSSGPATSTSELTASSTTSTASKHTATCTAFALRQAGALWHNLLKDDLKDLGFKQSKADECLFTIDDEATGFKARLITYVDDVLYFSNNQERMNQLLEFGEIGPQLLEVQQLLFRDGEVEPLEQLELRLNIDELLLE